MEIGLVGGGAATVCLLDQLAQGNATTTGTRVTVYEPSPQLWRGRPYQNDSTAIRVNTPPEDLSVRAGDPGHFIRWLAEHQQHRNIDIAPDALSGDVFVPRSVYGDYLDHTANFAVERLRHKGWRVDVVRDTVVAASREPGRVVLQTKRGEVRTANYAVLCVGVGRPADAYQLDGSPGYIADPYPTSEALADIGSRQSVVILGSGLTAVDATLALAARGHRGPIAMASRTGVLPAVRQRFVHHELDYFTQGYMRSRAREGRRVPLKDIVAVMRAELLAAHQDPGTAFAEIDAVGTEDPLDRMRRHLRAVNSPDLGMRIMQRAVPETGQHAWQLLSGIDKQHIMDGYLRAIMSLCCPIPPANASDIVRLADAGQLRIIDGLQAVKPLADGGFRLDVGGDPVTADVVVNAVSAPADRIPHKSSPLVDSMLKCGLAETNPYGGLNIECSTSRLTLDGKPDPRLFALGDITFGSLFFTFGIPVLVERGRDIVDTLLKDDVSADRSRWDSRNFSVIAEN